MITRIEIDGFKSFRNFALDLEPFQVFIGPNGAGKSNLFDAIALLSEIASGSTLMTAFRSKRGQLGELFYSSAEKESPREMSFAVEMLIGKTIDDGSGDIQNVRTTRVRYELKINLTSISGLPRLYIPHEYLKPIDPDQDKWIGTHIDQQSPSSWVMPQANDRVYSEFDRVNHSARNVSVLGGPTRANLSFVESAKTSPTVYAVRREMINWRMLGLDPKRIREKGTEFSDEISLRSDGSNLGPVLYRLVTDKYLLSDIERDLVNFIPEITNLVFPSTVTIDDTNSIKTMDELRFPVGVNNRDDKLLSLAVLSDGTLRALALIVLKNDPLHQGVLCVEEPENGVHPSRLEQIVGLLKDIATDFSAEHEYQDYIPRQVLIVTHSPALISNVPAESLWFIYMRNIKAMRSTGVLPMKRASAETLDRQFFTKDQLRRFLDTDALEHTLQTLGYEK